MIRATVAAHVKTFELFLDCVFSLSVHLRSPHLRSESSLGLRSEVRNSVYLPVVGYDHAYVAQVLPHHERTCHSTHICKDYYCGVFREFGDTVKNQSPSRILY